MDMRETNVMVTDNNFIKAKYDGRMSLNAMKLLRLTITQCKLTDKNFLEYEVGITDLGKMFRIEPDNLYREADKMTTQLMKTILYIGDGDPKHGYKKYTIFSECEYQPGSGVIKICISEKMIPFFLGLKKNFTRIPIGTLVTMKSKYTIRVYELICEKLKNTKIYANKHANIELSVEEIRSACSTENKLRQIGQFKERLLNVAVNEINSCGIGWQISYIDIKQGRKILGFNFKIESKNSGIIIKPEKLEHIEEVKAKARCLS